MADRITLIREQLVSHLAEKGSVHDWSHIVNQIGMFAYTGFFSDMVKELTANREICPIADGRINLAGLNSGNVEYIADLLHSVTKDHAKGSF
jgi:aspartate aminotransferase